MKNETGRPSRVGYINLNANYSTLLPAALEEDQRGAVVLRIPYLIGNFPERWFWSDLGQYIGPDGKPMEKQTPPTELNYFDETGPVGLVGCRSAGGGRIRFGGLAAASGVGTIVADYAVEKAETASNYAKINGLRSDIDGLSHWLNLWAHRTVMTLPKDGTPMSVSTVMELPPDVRLGRRLNLLATVTGTAPTTQQVEMRYTSVANLQTYSKTARPWNEHVQVHQAIRDLLRVAIWKPVTFRGHEVTSDHETVTTNEGEAPRSRWCPVKTSLTGISEPVWGSDSQPLFLFSDIQSVGLGKWLHLYEHNRRGLRPFLRLLDIRQGTIDEHVTQLGIALEALGYQEFRNSGLGAVASDKKTLAQRIRKIVGTVTTCLPEIPVSFPSDFADGYNAVKHANRPEASPKALLDNYRLGVKVLRVWIALQLGVSEKTIYERLR